MSAAPFRLPFTPNRLPRGWPKGEGRNGLSTMTGLRPCASRPFTFAPFFSSAEIRARSPLPAAAMRSWSMSSACAENTHSANRAAESSVSAVRRLLLLLCKISHQGG